MFTSHEIRKCRENSTALHNPFLFSFAFLALAKNKKIFYFFSFNLTTIFQNFFFIYELWISIRVGGQRLMTSLLITFDNPGDNKWGEWQMSFESSR